MITITAAGFISEQPELVYTGQGNSTAKIKFKVVDKQRRKERGSDQFVSFYETAIFEVWGEEAIRLADKLTRGRDVEVVGTNPKTEKWISNNDGKERSEWVFKLVHVNFPYRELPKQDERQGNAPQSPPPSQSPRFARNPAQSHEQRPESDCEPVPLPVQHAQKSSAPQRAAPVAAAVPGYQAPRQAGQGHAGEQRGGQNRFQRGPNQGPRVQY